MHLSRHITSGRAELATEVVGSGTAIVFLHANVCNRRMWKDQLDGLGTTYKAIAYDRRGFGESRSKPEDFSALADLMAVLDATADGEPAILVGCSLGGRIALEAALKYPSRVSALVLIAPNVTGAPEPTYSPELAKLMMQAKDAEASNDPDRLRTMKARLWLDGPLASEGRVAGQARDRFLYSFAIPSSSSGTDVDSTPLSDRLAEISVPTFVLWGDLDFPHVQARCRHVATTVPNAEGYEMPGVAHLPNLERPAEISALIAAFAARRAASNR
ncbi:MAG: alpha/beta hydrolase [Proteobacteria bacterium SG_bin9]|nr:MAG: alpha/beta hydrolase [Proteobacteria bacterium SG_bin9]